MIYAIGDIHGQSAALDRALALITADGGGDAQIVCVGDYTDRGPDSRGVLDTLIAGQRDGRRSTYLMGNHDRFFTRFVTEGRQHDPRVASGISWLNPRLGGNTTLASYGITGEPVLTRAADGLEYCQHYQRGDNLIPIADIQAEAQAAVPQAHLDFLQGLPLTYQTDDLLFVHAGLAPGVPLDAQDVEDLLWIRGDWLIDPRDHGALVVHGHTALDNPQHHGNRLNIDGGAGYGRPLHPVLIAGRDAWLITAQGRVALPRQT